MADWMEGPEGVPAGAWLLLMLPSSSREVIARWIYALCYRNAHVYIQVDMYAPPHLDVIPCRTPPPHPCVADNISVYPAPHSPTPHSVFSFPPSRPLVGLIFSSSAMPVYIAAQALYSGLDSIPFLPTLLRLLPYVVALVLLKLYCQGASNPAERNMHGKVVIITVNTSSTSPLYPTYPILPFSASTPN